uniref:Cytosolic fatty-acid binding proteins domain-containing protein n=1 Tax=Acartia pacifica TaxID=335913 RepID=A0A0U2UFD0_ACAPC|nr:hypothetical protein [Acartia pacifica]
MDDMVGVWQLRSRDNNFSDFLQCRGVSWFLRTLLTSSQPDMEYKLAADRGTFTKVTRSMFRTSEYTMPTEGEFCPLTTLSGVPEVGRITETSGGNVVLTMSYTDSGEDAATIIHRVEDGKLHVTLKCKDIVCRSVYDKKTDANG